jgi:signal peptidase I
MIVSVDIVSLGPLPNFMTQEHPQDANPDNPLEMSAEASETADQHRRGKDKDSSPHDVWWIEGLKTLGLSVILALGIRTFAAEARFIPTGSMEPTLLIDDRLLVDKVTYRFNPPERGDIVVFEPTRVLQDEGYKDAFIKRIIGLPGDQVAVINHRVFVNGKPLDETYIRPDILTFVEECPAKPNGPKPFLSEPQIIPANSYLVLGDNRGNSLDGRCWGVVPRENIIGRAALRFWPINRFGTIPAAGGK